VKKSKKQQLLTIVPAFMNIPSLEEAKERFFDGIYRPSIPRANFQKPFDDLDRGTRILMAAIQNKLNRSKLEINAAYF
jgi:hypothetical protein